MRTFWISTLGCKVNQYESLQIATLLAQAGLVRVDRPADADLRVVNTCAVTVQAASKSRQILRRAQSPSGRVLALGCLASAQQATPGLCADAVIGHDSDVDLEVRKLLKHWQVEAQPASTSSTRPNECDPPPEPVRNEGWMKQVGVPASQFAEDSKPRALPHVKQNPGEADMKVARGTAREGEALPEPFSAPTDGSDGALPSRRAPQRALLKVQDGCDARCAYCIVPSLRPRLWSKPVDEAVTEARQLVAAGHAELVLTGIFLGAYGHQTALRRRQAAGPSPLAGLVAALCGRVPGLRRLRLSSLEPGDLTDELIVTLAAWPQVAPHFHVPLQSGSDALLRRMNRQYGRDGYLRMLDRVQAAFNRPALTTDIIVGFPGETDAEFERTLDVVGRARFLRIHAFPFSPRPGTAAARWTDQFVHGPVVNERIKLLETRSAEHSLAFRRQFVGETVEVMVERPRRGAQMLHGRCERYFAVHFAGPLSLVGRSARVRVECAEVDRTLGHLIEPEPV